MNCRECNTLQQFTALHYFFPKYELLAGFFLIQCKEIYDIRFIFNEESDYSEENTIDNEDFRCTIFQQFQVEPEQKKK